MRSIDETFETFGKRVLWLGYAGEEDRSTLIVDLHDILLEFPGATAVLKVRPPDEKAAYPAITETIDDKLHWSIGDSDTAKEGRGELQLSLISPTGSKIKTAVAAMEISRSLPDGGQKPDRIDDWMENAEVARRKAEEAATKANTAASNADTATTKANEATSKANTAASNADTKAKLANDAAKRAEDAAEKADKARQNILIGSETGNTVSVSDAFSASLCGLTVYGKSTQDGTPSPDNPVPIVNAGDGGTITVTLGDGADERQTITLQTPNGLRGIPVASGGNYTDPTGQQWVCDEVDLERVIYKKRVSATVLTVDMIQTLSANPNDYCIVIKSPIDYKYTAGIRVVLMSNRFRYEKQIKNKGVIFGYGSQIRLYVDPNEIETLDAAKEFIEKNRTEIMYEVNEPVETPLTPAELAAYKALTTYAPNTVVQAADGAGLKLDYQRDVNIVIKNLEDAIASMTTT